MTDEIKHRVFFSGYLVYVRESSDPTKAKWTATLLVDEHGYTELHDWRWGEFKDPHRGYRLSTPEDMELWKAMKEVWEVLSETLEYVELKPIGPEDSEYFATDKLWEVIKK